MFICSECRYTVLDDKYVVRSHVHSAVKAYKNTSNLKLKEKPSILCKYCLI